LNPSWHKLKPELFKKQPYYLPGCDKWIFGVNSSMENRAARFEGMINCLPVNKTSGGQTG
jgi:hypothetical protein